MDLLSTVSHHHFYLYNIRGTTRRINPIVPLKPAFIKRKSDGILFDVSQRGTIPAGIWEIQNPPLVISRGLRGSGKDTVITCKDELPHLPITFKDYLKYRGLHV